jgi:hypothetical protein
MKKTIWRNVKASAKCESENEIMAKRRKAIISKINNRQAVACKPWRRQRRQRWQAHRGAASGNKRGIGGSVSANGIEKKMKMAASVSAQ